MLWKRIGELDKEGERALVVGVVITTMENHIILDDGTGKLRVYHDEPWKVNLKSVVIAAGIIISVDQSFKEMKADAIADISGIDIKLLKRVEMIRDMSTRLVLEKGDVIG